MSTAIEPWRKETFFGNLRARWSMRRRDLPPGRKGMPYLGNLLPLVRDPLGYCTRMTREYPRLFTTNFGRPQLEVWLNDPDLIEEMFVGNAKSYRKESITRQLIPLLGRGLLTSEGE